MALIRNHTTLAGWIAEQEIPAGTSEIEFNAVDDITTPTANIDLWIRLTDADGTAWAFLMTAGAPYFKRFLGSQLPAESFTYSVKKATTDGDAAVVLS